MFDSYFSIGSKSFPDVDLLDVFGVANIPVETPKERNELWVMMMISSLRLGVLKSSFQAILAFLSWVALWLVLQVSMFTG